MKSTVENLSPTRVKLEIQVEASELKPMMDKVVKDLAGQIQVPGFRSGKVPAKLVEQRVGKAYIMEQSVNEAMNTYYQQAVGENELIPLAQPEVEVNSIPDPEKQEGELKFTVEVDVRPEIEIPELSDMKITVDAAEANDEDVDKALEDLRERFGTLKGVDRPAAEGDFVSIDLKAVVNDEEVDNASGMSYQIGSGNMLEGMDEALIGMSEGESTVFSTKLAGGDFAGQPAEVHIELKSVKTRELPEADDEFAALASPFDTIAELKEDLAKQASEGKAFQQGVQARDKALDQLLEIVDVPVPDSVIESQLEEHFSGETAHSAAEGHDTPEHREEVREGAAKAFKAQVLLDALAMKHDVQVSQQELIDYIVASAQEYGMNPNEFAKIMDQNGQVPMIVGEVGRRKALGKVLEVAEVVDTNGNAVDLTRFLDTAEENEQEADETSGGDSIDATEDAPVDASEETTR